jgi:Zn ribbon nucleic-acid-binding protein
LTDCISCHSGNVPTGHYPYQCSTCHNIDTWTNGFFNHTGITDCISCHLSDRPHDHDAGQCSNCHNTRRWGD